MRKAPANQLGHGYYRVKISAIPAETTAAAESQMELNIQPVVIKIGTRDKNKTLVFFIYFL